MRLLYCTLIAVTIANTTTAQSSLGSEFWLGYMENLTLDFNDAPRFSLIVESIEPTEGFINVPTTGLSIPFTTPANSVTEVFLPDAVWYAQGSENVENKGIQIVTDNDVRLSAMHYRAYFSESTQVLPAGELGTEYLVTAYKDDSGNDPSSFVIVSTQDNTEVEVTPSTLTSGLRPPDIPFVVELEEGQTYQVQATGDLTGTRIRSLNGAELAVFSGARQADVQICPGGADSHIYDQAFSIDRWAELYLAVPFKNQVNDVVKVVAQQNGTVVYFDCIPVATLNTGEFYLASLSEPTVISATAPVAVSQFNTSGSCSNSSSIGDPNMMRLLPATYQGQSVRFLSSGLFNALLGADYFSEHYVNIIVPSSQTGGLTLDGGPISAGNFQPFPGNPSYAYAQIDLSEGEHVISSEIPFQAYSYGFGQFDAYTTRLGYGQSVDVPFACLAIEVEGNFCVDSLLQFSYTSGLSVASQSWDFNGQGISNEVMPGFLFSQPGAVEVILTIETEDGSTFTDTLQIDIQECSEDICDTPQQLSIVAEEEACTNTSIPLAFEFSGEFLAADWFFENGLVESGESPEVQFSGPGVYNFDLLVTDIYNCPYPASGSIEVVECGPCPPSQVDIQYEGLPCVDSLIIFELPFNPEVNPPVLVEWNINGILYNELYPELTFTQPGPVSGSFFAQDLLGCLYEGAFELDIIDCEDNPCVGLPPLSISLPDPICLDSLYSFSAITEAELTSYEWEATNGTDTNEPVFTTSFQETEIFTVFLNATDADGCSYSAGIDIEVVLCDAFLCLESITIETDSLAVCADSSVIFSAGGVGEVLSYRWALGDGSTSTAASPSASYVPGVYDISLEVTAADGCVYTDGLSIEAADCVPAADCIYNFPNVFSPNGDGINDEFQLLFGCPPQSYKLQVFNRWGGLVFETDDFMQGWDGTLRDKPCAVEVYAYQALVQKPDGEEMRFQGTLTLLR